MRVTVPSEFLKKDTHWLRQLLQPPIPRIPSPDTGLHMSLELGVCQGPEEYVKFVNRAGRGFNLDEGNPNKIGLRTLRPARPGTRINLVFASVEELGFSDHAYFGDIWPRAKRIGWGLCSTEVPFALVPAVRKQPHGDMIKIAMKPFAARDMHWEGFPYRKYVFAFGHSNGADLWLSTVRAEDDEYLHADEILVFTYAPKKSGLKSPTSQSQLANR